MSLALLIRGHMSSLCELDSTCFTHVNYGAHPGGNTTLSVNTPLGVLGGSVAGLSGTADYTAFPCNKILQPIGLFANDAAGAAFDNSPAVASNKLAIVKGMSSLEVDVYETVNEANNANLTYVVGNKLYCSVNNLLTNELSTSAIVIGIVLKAPSLASPTIGLDMRI